MVAWYWPLLAIYATSSVILTYIPRMVWPAYNNKTRHLLVKHGSHRGGAAENHENTIRAFRHARACGGDLLELDCHLTADGQVVVFHDFTLQRVCGQSHNISSVNSTDLPHLIDDPVLPPPFHPPLASLSHSKANVFPNAASSFSSSSTKAQAELESELHRIPLLEDVFKEFPDATINIDLKHYSPELIRKVAQLINKYNRHHNTIVGSFAAKTSAEFSQVAPNVPLIFSALETLKVYALYFTGLLPFFPLTADVLEVPLFTPHLQQMFWMNFLSHRPHLAHPVTFKDRVQLYGTRSLLSIMSYILSRKTLYRHLQQRGVKVIFWTLNTEEEFDYAFRELNADGVMTDYPSRLTSYLQKHDAAWSSSHSKVL